MLDHGTKTPKNHAHLSDLIKLSSEDGYGGGYEPVSTRALVLGNGGLASSVDEDGSGASTPPLWRSESPDSRRRNYLALSPRSRTDAIARGQMELMDMVKNIPEGCYELSLKDLVEVNRGIGQERLLEGPGQKGGSYARRAGARAQRQHHHQQMVKGGSLDGNSGGFLLKMVLPVPWSARKKKKKRAVEFDASSGNDGRIGGNVVPVKEWWKMRGSLSASARGEGIESSGESRSLNSGSRKGSSSNSWSGSSNNGSRRYELS